MKWQRRDRRSTPACRAAVLVLALVAAGLVMVMAPTPAAALTTATQVSAGGRTTCALMTGGNSYC